MGVKCPARGTQKSSLGHWGSSWTWGQESLWSQGGLVFLERRGSAGAGQVSLLAAGRALATARGRAPWARRSSSSPALQPGKVSPGWAGRSALPRCVCARQLCQQRVCSWVTPGEILQLLGQFSFNNTCSTSVAGAAFGFEGLPGAGSQSWPVLPGQCVLQGLDTVRPRQRCP